MMGVPMIGESAHAQPTCQPKVSYRGIQMEWDYFARSPGLGVLHIVCPRCAKFGLIASTNKRFHVDPSGRLSIDEPFRCDYCLWRFGVIDNRMMDA
jgi:hypothetical protein